MTSLEATPNGSQENEPKESEAARLFNETFGHFFPDATTQESGSEIEIDLHDEEPDDNQNSSGS